SLYHFFLHCSLAHHVLHSFPTRRSSDLRAGCSRAAPSAAARSGRCRAPAAAEPAADAREESTGVRPWNTADRTSATAPGGPHRRSEEHTSELQSRGHLVCRLLLEKKKKK